MSNSTAPRSTYVVLVVGILAVSFAAILIRYAQLQGIPSLYIAAFRLLGAAALLLPITLTRYSDEIQSLRPADWALASVSGLFLAAHFAFWTLSLEYTTVLISVTLVTTAPIWTALLEWMVLRQPPRQMLIIGMAIAIIGGVILGVPVESPGVTTPAGSNNLVGATLAVLGAIAVAVYLTIGRKLRVGLSLFPYVWIVYSIGGIALLPILVIQRVPLVGYSTQGYFWLIGLAVFPQLIGHSSLNYAVKYVSATYILILTKLEPIISAAVAFFAFTEIPNHFEIIGSIVILLGVIIASIRQQARHTSPSTTEVISSS